MNVVLSPSENETTSAPASNAQDWRFKRLGLSRQESKVIELAMEGRIDKQIAQEIGISLGTVRVYWKRLRFKTGGTRSEAIAKLAKMSLQLDYDEMQQRAATLQSQLDDRHESEDRRRTLETAFSLVGFPLAVVDARNGEVVLANGSFAALSDHEAAELPGTVPFSDAESAKKALSKTSLKPQKCKLALRKEAGNTPTMEFSHCGEPDAYAVLWQTP